MLIEAKELQQNAVAKLINLSKTKKDVVFRAPTGSGKTYMMADFMNRILAENSDIVFVVSARSKGDLDKQNYEKFCEYINNGTFTNLNPYLINSDIAGEERLFIPLDYNVYILPSDLTKKGGRLMQGALHNFLNTMTSALYDKNKTLYLIKDECHIATNNLDISLNFFTKTFYFSATPRLSRGQHPDIIITDEEAENAKLIKTIVWGDNETTEKDAIAKFKEIKNDYINKLGINPCLIIQISNKDKEEEEWAEIQQVLNENPDLKWMLIVNENKKCDTNDQIKTKLPVSQWKNFVKSNGASIDIIIFKMVISEGWDIPRACMLYQKRNTQSRQLDEQVIGRVRRNPYLLDFEVLPKDAQYLAMTAWVWGIKPEEQEKVYGVKLKTDFAITSNVKIKTTKLKSLTQKEEFDLETFLSNKPIEPAQKSIFDIGRELKDMDIPIKTLFYQYTTDYNKWWKAAQYVKDIITESNKFYNDYSQSMMLDQETSFALTSHYIDKQNYVNINNWIWKRNDGKDKFSFDGEAEREWANILNNISKDIEQLKAIEKDFIAEKSVCLWGKNYLPNSVTKFEYYMGGVKNSYPDFVMKDKYGRIHIFEVKSVNKSANQILDENLYKAKIEELRKCYLQASKITKQFFYLPIVREDVWQIKRFMDGKEEELTIEMFINFVKNQP